MGKLQESRNYDEDTLLKESNDLIYDLNAKLDSVDVDKEPTIHEQIRNIKKNFPATRIRRGDG